ncbi:MAG: hypothetical protein NVS1B13_26720 [Flavisolibacter sp.]
MNTDRNKETWGQSDSAPRPAVESRSSVPNDLPETQKDAEALKEEETFIDLPEVKDIPGQEFIKVPSLGPLADITLSSRDEEGDDVFDQGDEVI